jgi:hypothetical protein
MPSLDRLWALPNKPAELKPRARTIGIIVHKYAKGRIRKIRLTQKTFNMSIEEPFALRELIRLIVIMYPEIAKNKSTPPYGIK